MTFVEYEQSYIFSSAERNGARNRSSDGSTFDVQLSGPITIPKEAVNCTIEVTFAPTADGGPFGATVTVSSNDPDTPNAAVPCSSRVI